MQLSDLPIELLLDHILPFLSLRSVLALTCASKFFATLCSDDTFWKLKLKEDFNFTPDANTARESGWKVIYRGVRKPSVYTWGGIGEGRLGIPPNSLGNRRVGVELPVKVNIKARVVSLVAGGWCFHALDDAGNIYVWGQLQSQGQANRGHGFSNAAERAATPHRLQISYPGSNCPVKFTAVSCSRSHSVALDSERRAWLFTSWGRPILLDSPPLVSPPNGKDGAILQVEPGWDFISVLTEGGKVFVTWPETEGETFHTEARTKNEELDQNDSTKALPKVMNGENIIPCTSLKVEAAPLLLPPIPGDLPDIVYDTTSATFDASIDSAGKVVEAPHGPSALTKIVRIAAGNKFIVALTNKGHVLYINLNGGGEPLPGGSEWLRGQWTQHLRTGWQYLPEYSEVAKVAQTSMFSTTGEEKMSPPTRMRITHISAHYNSFVAYSTTPSTAPYPSLVLLGLHPSPNNIEQKIYPSLLDQSIMSFTLGDHHRAALTSSGNLLTWGAYSDGALGLQNLPTQLAPGGDNDRVTVTEGGWAQPDKVKVPSQVKFDQDGKKLVVCVAASGALVIDLDPKQEKADLWNRHHQSWASSWTPVR